MKLIWQEVEIEYSAPAESLPAIRDQIVSWTSSEEIANYYLCVDGTDVYEDCLTYLNEHIAQFAEVEVITQSKQQFAERLAESMGEYLERAVPQLKQLYMELYQQADPDLWSRLSDLFEGLQWLHEAASMFPDSDEAVSEAFAAFRSKIDEIAQELEGAVGGRDTITIADLIQYELHPAYVDLHEAIERILDKKVVVPDVN